MYNLTAAGEKMFLNAVRHMLGLQGFPATKPAPADKATEVSIDTSLSWTPNDFNPTPSIWRRSTP
jgi:hypothetical protein